MALMPVEDARARILRGARRGSSERVRLAEGLGRVLAAHVTASRDQPPFEASAMDGYAVKASDVAAVPAVLKVIGTSAAGRGFKGRAKPGEAVRIFTGAPLPKGTDAVVIQENTSALTSSEVTILHPVRQAQNVPEPRPRLQSRRVLLAAGTRLNARDIGLAGAANAGLVRVVRKPLVAVFATGDELVAPGRRPNPDQIVSSNSQALVALVQHFGGEPLDLGIVPDRLKATERTIARAAGADVLVTTAALPLATTTSFQQALRNAGVKIDFWKIAMRPGKPFMYGRKGRQHVMGLPATLFRPWSARGSSSSP